MCPEIPQLTFEIINSSIIINCKCNNNHFFKVNIENIKSLQKVCGKCKKEILVKYNYSSINKCYLCDECSKFDKKLINIYSIFLNVEDKNKLNDFFDRFQNSFIELSNFSEKFIHSKYYDFYQILIKDFTDLLNNNYYNKELMDNMINYQNIPIKRLLSIYDNYKIIFEKNVPQILFSNFYNVYFRKYYKSELKNFSEILNLIKLYEKHKITTTELDEEKFFNFINKSINKIQNLTENYMNKIKDKLKDLKKDKEAIEYKLKNVYYNFRLMNYEILYNNYTIPSIFILKRKLIKGIIDFIHSIEYKNIKTAIPNYKFLFMFFNRLYEVKEKIKDNNLQNKIENVLYVIKEELYKLIKEEKNKLSKFREINQIESKKIQRFSEEEMILINEKCSKLEKERLENKYECEYEEKNKKKIHLTFLINFLNFIKEQSNDLIHILLEDNCQYFLNETKSENKLKKLEDYINKLCQKEIISDKVSGDELIEMFFFQPKIKDKECRVLNELEFFLNNNNIEINEDNLDFSNDINEINTYFDNFKIIQDYFQKIIKEEGSDIKLIDDIEENKGIEYLLGIKRERENETENYKNYIIKKIYNAFNYIELCINNSKNLKEKILTTINNIIHMNLKIKKIELIINEMDKYPIKEFSFNKLFKEWKKKELENIKLFEGTVIYNEVNNELKNLSFDVIKKDLKLYIENNKNKNFYFYNEEGDISTNLFLYQNQIPPDLCKLCYKYIK